MEEYFLTWLTRDRLRELRATATREALGAASRPRPARWRRALGLALIKLGERIASTGWRETWTVSGSAS